MRVKRRDIAEPPETFPQFMADLRMRQQAEDAEVLDEGGGRPYEFVPPDEEG